jgi:hypothetical protein
MGLFDKDALKGGFIVTMVKDILRGMLNRALKETTPKQLVDAIETDASLWGDAQGDIMAYASGLPDILASGIADARIIVESQYGGFDQLVLMWLEEDHKVYYNIITRTSDGKSNEKGKAWLKRQIYDILDGVEKEQKSKNGVVNNAVDE